jgi:hypothetical protein
MICQGDFARSGIEDLEGGVEEFRNTDQNEVEKIDGIYFGEFGQSLTISSKHKFTINFNT